MFRLLIYGVIAYVLYNFFVNGKDKNSVPFEDIIIDPNVNKDLLSQPSQKYPVKRELDMRRDGSNQPWYVSSRTFQGVRDDLKEITGFDVTNIKTSFYDVQEFWNDLNNRYGVH